MRLVNRLGGHSGVLGILEWNGMVSSGRMADILSHCKKNENIFKILAVK